MKANKNKSFKVYSDPGHGWVAVKRKFLGELKILDRLSAFSFHRGQTVYLEEDCDAAIFIQAYSEKFGDKPQFIERHSDKPSPIRSYDRVSPSLEAKMKAENVRFMDTVS